MLHRSPVDPRAAAALIAPMFMMFFLGMVVLRALAVAVFRGARKLGAAGHDRQIGDVPARDQSRRKRLSFGHATGRFFAKIVSGMVPLAIGYIMAAFTERKQALHDLIAGTLVLKK